MMIIFFLMFEGHQSPSKWSQPLGPELLDPQDTMQAKKQRKKNPTPQSEQRASVHETLASEPNPQHVNNHTHNPKAPTPKEKIPHHTKKSMKNNHCNAHPAHSIPKSAPTTSNTKTNHSPSSSTWGTTTLCTTRKKRER